MGKPRQLQSKSRGFYWHDGRMYVFPKRLLKGRRQSTTAKGKYPNKGFIDGSYVYSWVGDADKPYSTNASSGIRGVTRLKSGSYRAEMQFKKTHFYAGQYKTVEEATKARHRLYDNHVEPYIANIERSVKNGKKTH